LPESVLTADRLCTNTHVIQLSSANNVNNNTYFGIECGSEKYNIEKQSFQPLLQWVIGYFVVSVHPVDLLSSLYML
jgi:hypothetical protein